FACIWFNIYNYTFLLRFSYFIIFLIFFSFCFFLLFFFFFFFNDPATTEIYTLSLHDALPISPFNPIQGHPFSGCKHIQQAEWPRSEEHTSELQSRSDLVCRLLLEKKKKKKKKLLKIIKIKKTLYSFYIQHNYITT